MSTRTDIDDLRYRFEKAFRDGPRPTIDEFLPANAAAAAARLPALCELAHSELELRLRAGEPAELTEYLGRYPDLRQFPAVLAAMLETELKIRLARGERLEVAAVEARHPDLGPRVREVFRRVSHAPPSVPGYELLEMLGRGGMGVVYKARHLLLKRDVAVKLIRRDVPAQSAVERRLRERFLREAEAAAAVRHPNVAQVYDFGEAGGDWFLVMEHLAGGTLADRLDEHGPFAPAIAAEVVARLADGVQAVHAAGVVHRDLKPGNVMLVAPADGGPPNPKLVDFGLAKRDGTPLTTTGAVVGTPAYMAPEQTYELRPEEGPTVDVWALGVILYECLTGSRPFEGADPLDTMLRIRRESPPAPSRLRPGVPPELDAICLWCLAKSPAQRPASAAALAAALRSPTTFLRPRPRRRRGVLVAAGLTLAVAAILAWVLVKPPPGETRPDPPAPMLGSPTEWPLPVVAAGDPIPPARTFPTGLKGAMLGVGVSADGELVVVYERDLRNRRVGLYRTADGTAVTPPGGIAPLENLQAVLLGPGELVAFAGDAGLAVGSRAGRATPRPNATGGQRVLAPFPDRADRFLSCDGETIWQWEWTTDGSAAVAKLPTRGGDVRLAVSPDRRRLLVGRGRDEATADAPLLVGDIGPAGNADLRPLGEFPAGGNVTAVAWAADGKSLYAGVTANAARAELRHLDAATGKAIRPAVGFPFEDVSSLALSPDGRWLAVACYGGNGESLSVFSADLSRRLGLKSGGGMRVAWAADGRLVAACADGQVRVWAAEQFSPAK